MGLVVLIGTIATAQVMPLTPYPEASPGVASDPWTSYPYETEHRDIVAERFRLLWRYAILGLDVAGHATLYGLRGLDWDFPGTREVVTIHSLAAAAIAGVTAWHLVDLALFQLEDLGKMDLVNQLAEIRFQWERTATLYDIAGVSTFSVHILLATVYSLAVRWPAFTVPQAPTGSWYPVFLTVMTLSWSALSAALGVVSLVVATERAAEARKRAVQASWHLPWFGPETEPDSSRLSFDLTATGFIVRF